MGNLEDLHTLSRLLAEFELPVSPILQYAIKCKEEELSDAQTNDLVNETIPEIIKPQKLKVSLGIAGTIKQTKKTPSHLRIYRTDGTIIEETKSAATMVKAIKEIGPDIIYDMKIPMDTMHLVTIGGNPLYPSAQHDVGNGFFVNVHSNTQTKKRQLERIFKKLELNWRVEVIEP